MRMKSQSISGSVEFFCVRCTLMAKLAIAVRRQESVSTASRHKI
jgi:hypothetical protein